MFGIYFGNFLVDEGIITKEQYNEVAESKKNTRVKLGLLAVEEKIMTEDQAYEVNMLQTMMDKRFGDIAVSKGYLTEEQVGELLKKQGNPYLQFVQCLTEENILSLEDIQKYINLYKKKMHISAQELEDIKEGDLEKIVPIFLKNPLINATEKEYISLCMRNILRFIDTDLRIESADIVNSEKANYIASQSLIGNHKIFSAIDGDEDVLVNFASIYGKEDFSEVNPDVLDAICEFLNCNNGLFASKLSINNVEIDMEPPVMSLESRTITSDKLIKVPVYLSGKRINLLMSFDSAVNVN